jgi:hypothetical protein
MLRLRQATEVKCGAHNDAVALQRREDQHVAEELLVDARGAIVPRCAPHTVVDAHGWRDVRPCEAKA